MQRLCTAPHAVVECVSEVVREGCHIVYDSVEDARAYAQRQVKNVLNETFFRVCTPAGSWVSRMDVGFQHRPGTSAPC